MILSLLALLAITLLFLKERETYLRRRDHARSMADIRAERQARDNTAPFRPHVDPAPINPPASVHPIAFARARRDQRDPRTAA